MKRPQPGDHIEHECAMSGPRTGTVEYLLSAQFAYRTQEGEVRLCLFSEPWRVMQDSTSGK